MSGRPTRQVAPLRPGRRIMPDRDLPPLQPAGAGQPLSTADLVRPAQAEPPAGAPQVRDEPSGPLFPAEEIGRFQSQWDAIQASFVDEPRRAVEQADQLVASAMARLAQIFAEQRAGLEGQWDRGEQVSTEDLRVTLQRYRSFFSRLLAM
jgi:hypothetical protein